MKPSAHHMHRAHVWLYNAGLSQDAVDTQGNSLAVSLALQFGLVEREGRREAIYEYSTRTRSGEFDIEDTGRYDSKEFKRLIAEAKKESS